MTVEGAVWRALWTRPRASAASGGEALPGDEPVPAPTRCCMALREPEAGGCDSSWPRAYDVAAKDVVSSPRRMSGAV